MVREDIAAGLRNAVDRGSSIEKAKQSFISAGYSPREVEEAAQFIGGFSAAPLIQPAGKMFPQPRPLQLPQQIPVPSSPQIPFAAVQPAKSKGLWKIIVLVGVLLFLIVVLILTILFREKITSWFG